MAHEMAESRVFAVFITRHPAIKAAGWVIKGVKTSVHTLKFLKE
jgi:hypothetical protein